MFARRRICVRSDLLQTDRPDRETGTGTGTGTGRFVKVGECRRVPTTCLRDIMSLGESWRVLSASACTSASASASRCVAGEGAGGGGEHQIVVRQTGAQACGIDTVQIGPRLTRPSSHLRLVSIW